MRNRNGRHDTRAQPIHGDAVWFNRVQRLVGEVLAHRERVATRNQGRPSGEPGEGLVANAGEFLARATWLESGGEDDLDPRRSLWDECGYPRTRFMSPQRWKTLHDRDAVAAAVNEIIVRAAWQVNPDIFEREQGKVVSAFDKSFADLGQALRSPTGIPSHFGQEGGNPILGVWQRANALCRISRFGIVVYGLDDGEDLDQPVGGIQEQGSVPGEEQVQPKDGKPIDPQNGEAKVVANRKNWPRWNLVRNAEMVKGRKLRFASAFDESLVWPLRFETNVQSPRFGRPTVYRVSFHDPKNPIWGSGAPLSTKNIHWTRVQHVCDTTTAYDSSIVYAAPANRCVLNNVLALSKVAHGGAEGYWKAVFSFLFLETHPQLGGDVDVDDEAIKGMLEDMMNSLQRYGVTTGMSAKTVAPTVSDPKSHADLHFSIIAMKTRTPKRMLMGSERGELSSGQDSDEWDDHVRGYQNNFVSSDIIRPGVDQLIWYGVLAPSEGNDLKCRWPDISSMPASMKATILQQRTAALAAYNDSPGAAAAMSQMDWLVKEFGYTEEEAAKVIENASGQFQDVHGDGGVTMPDQQPEQIQDWQPPPDEGPQAEPPPDFGQASAVGNVEELTLEENERLCWGKPCPEGAGASAGKNVASTKAQALSAQADKADTAEHHGAAAAAHQEAARKHFEHYLQTGDEPSAKIAQAHGAEAARHMGRAQSVGSGERTVTKVKLPEEKVHVDRTIKRNEFEENVRMCWGKPCPTEDFLTSNPAPEGHEYVYRVQPAGKEIKGHQSMTSMDEPDPRGVHVFGNLEEARLASAAWGSGALPDRPEIITIKVPKGHIRDTGDYEGYVIHPDKGEIVHRETFGSKSEFMDRARKK